jgi:hypothetical protein
MISRFVSRFLVNSAAAVATIVLAVTANAASLKVTITDVTTGDTISQTQSSPDVNGDYNGPPVNFSVGSASPPFQNVSITVNGTANPPGSPTSFLFPDLSTSVTATNFTGTTHEFKIVFDAETYTLPSANPVDILTQIDTNDARRADTTHPSTMTASAAGGVTFSRTVSLGNIDGAPVDGGLHAHSGSYTLEQSYDLFVLGSGNFQVKSGMVTTVVPEPATVILAMLALPFLIAAKRFSSRVVA